MSDRAETLAMTATGDEAIVVLSTFPSIEKATDIARTLVGEGLAACVNLVPAVRSIYRWQGNVHDDQEVLAVLKTSRARYDELATRLAALHPYEVPEILAFTVEEGSAAYLEWLRASTAAK